MRQRVRCGVLVGSLAVAGALLFTGPARADAESERRAKIRELARSHTEQAVHGLARVIRHDKALSVRVAAARGFAENRAPRATEVLCGLVGDGGPDAVRTALAESLARHEDATKEVQRRLGSKRLEEPARSLLVCVLGSFADQASLTALEKMARGEPAAVRVAALEALSRRADAKLLLPGVVDLVLSRHTDTATVIAALEIAEGFDLNGMEVIAPVLDKVRRAGLEVAVARVKRRLAFLRKFAEYRRKKDSRYAIPQPLEPVSQESAFHDVVFAFDTTGSEGPWLPSVRAAIWEDVTAMRTEGLRVRVGFVAYRDHLRDANQRMSGFRVRVLPLTRDLAAARQWLWALGAGGVDTAGAAISSALDVSLGRMNWRPGSSRRVELFTATRLDSPQRCFDLVRFYRQYGDVAIGVRVRPNGERNQTLEKLARTAGGALGDVPFVRRSR